MNQQRRPGFIETLLRGLAAPPRKRQQQQKPKVTTPKKKAGGGARRFTFTSPGCGKC